MARGNWNIFGINLPEFGISEALGGRTESLPQEYAPPKEVVDSFLSKATATQSVAPRSVAPTSRTSSSSSYTGSSGGSNTDHTDLYNKVSKPEGEDPVELARKLEEARKRKEEEDRKRILKQTRRSYDPFFADLARQEAEIPTIEQEYMNTLNTGYQNQADTIARGQQAGLAQADASTGVIKQNQATSLRDLASNLSSAVNAFGQRLGQAGAGDSSAANMANYAYSKLANRNTADVMKQVRTQLAEVEMAKQNIVRDAQDKLGALETWKATQTQTIAGYVRSLRDYVNQARAQGKQSLAENEVNMIKEGFARAMERMQQINDLAVTSAEEIRQNAAAGLADAQSFSQQLSLMGNTNPADINTGVIDQGTIGDTGSTQLPIPGVPTEEKEQSLSDLLNSESPYVPLIGY